MSIKTNGGDIVLWSNSGNETSASTTHDIYIGDGATFESAGGKIILAGGEDSNTDDYPDGYAYIGGDYPEYSGPVGGRADDSDLEPPAISLGSLNRMDGDRITFKSTGGDIILRGHSGRNDVDGSSAIQTQRQLVIDSGSGTILIDGKKTGDELGAGLRFGGQNKFPDVAITSSSAASPAVQLKGTSNKGHGILLGLGYLRRAILRIYNQLSFSGNLKAKFQLMLPRQVRDPTSPDLHQMNEDDERDHCTCP